MIIDDVMPAWDATRIEHVVVDAEPADVYKAAMGADLMSVYRGSAALRLLFGLRGAASALVRRLRSEPRAPDPESLRLADLEDEGEWVKLGGEPGREIVFGAVGRFWGREIVWRRIRAGEFRSFAEPGNGKVAANISVREYGPGRSLLSYEARTATTDAAARRGFRRYWRLVTPGVGIVMRTTLRYIRDLAEEP